MAEWPEGMSQSMECRMEGFEMTASQATNLVSIAAKELDRAAPGWHNSIDIGTLDLSNSNSCIIGQLVRASDSLLRAEGHWPNWIHEVDLDFQGKVLKAILSSDEKNYPILQDAWVSAIADRIIHRHSDSQRHEETVA